MTYLALVLPWIAAVLLVSIHTADVHDWRSSSGSERGIGRPIPEVAGSNPAAGHHSLPIDATAALLVLRPDRYREAVVRAYSDHDPIDRHHGWRFITATGVKTRSAAGRRGVAVPPSVIRYGSAITVPGYGTATADDTGGALRRRTASTGELHIEVRMPNPAQARAWGVRRCVVEVRP